MTPRLLPLVLHIFQSYLIIVDFQFTTATKTQPSFRTNSGEPSQCWQDDRNHGITFQFLNLLCDR